MLVQEDLQILAKCYWTLVKCYIEPHAQLRMSKNFSGADANANVKCPLMLCPGINMYVYLFGTIFGCLPQNGPMAFFGPCPMPRRKLWKMIK
jgi:hypothetical protein